MHAPRQVSWLMGERRWLGGKNPAPRRVLRPRLPEIQGDPVAAWRSELPKHSGGTAADSYGLPFSPV